MKLIIVADIFGKTAALMRISTELGAIDVIDPYDGIEMCFNSEDEAYRYFSEHVGLDHYLEIIIQRLQHTTDVTLVGFSVGAAAIWRLSDSKIATNINSAIGFYGSQIRHTPDIQPLFPIELIFPASETHFDVTQLKNRLSTTENVSTCQVDFRHGFMNYHSINFDYLGYQVQQLRLRKLFEVDG